MRAGRSSEGFAAGRAAGGGAEEPAGGAGPDPEAPAGGGEAGGAGRGPEDQVLVVEGPGARLVKLNGQIKWSNHQGSGGQADRETFLHLF